MLAPSLEPPSLGQGLGQSAPELCCGSLGHQSRGRGHVILEISDSILPFSSKTKVQVA